MPRKQEDPMQKNLAFARVYLDREALARFQRIAQVEGRSLQRQLGIVLERFAALSRENPSALREIGMLSNFATQPAA